MSSRISYGDIILFLQVSREFGLTAEIGSTLLQCAESLIPPTEGEKGRQAVISASLYRKFNRMRDGELEIGDVAPNIGADLVRLTPHCNGGFISSLVKYSDLVVLKDMCSPVGSFCHKSIPTVIVASSYS